MAKAAARHELRDLGRRIAAAHRRANGSRKIAGIKLEHVPYRGGGAGDQRSRRRPSQDRIARVVPADPALQGRHRAPAGTNAPRTRSPSLPDVPTYQEAGINGLVLDQWLGVFVPAGHAAGDRGAPQQRDRTRRSAEAAIRESFLQSAQEPVGGSADAFCTARARRFCEVRAAGARAEYQSQLDEAHRRRTGAARRRIRAGGTMGDRASDQGRRISRRGRHGSGDAGPHHGRHRVAGRGRGRMAGTHGRPAGRATAGPDTDHHRPARHRLRGRA